MEHPGHTALECKDNRVLDLSKIESKSPEEAWDALLKADKSQDLDDIRDVRKTCNVLDLTNPLI